MEIIKYPARNTWAHIVERPHLDARMLGETVSDMLADIRCRGDEAVREYVRRFQGAEIGALEVSPEEMAEAEAAVSSELKEAIAVAGENISRFHASQTMETRKVETIPGVVCWQKAVPIERVGLYSRRYGAAFFDGSYVGRSRTGGRLSGDRVVYPLYGRRKGTPCRTLCRTGGRCPSHL